MITIVENGVHVVYITTDALYDHTDVQSVQEELDRLLKTQPVQSLVIDFSQVHAAGSAALSMLMRLRTKCKEDDRELGLSGMNTTVREVMKITNLDGMFRIRDKADQFIQGPRPPR